MVVRFCGHICIGGRSGIDVYVIYVCVVAKDCGF